MAQVFFCNSGTEANETALKIARKATGRPLVVAMEGGFHGRTIGSLSVTGGAKYRDPFPESLASFSRFVPFGDLEALSAQPLEQAAAVILEPVQSMAGVRIAPGEYYRALREACRGAGTVPHLRRGADGGRPDGPLVRRRPLRRGARPRHLRQGDRGRVPGGRGDREPRAGGPGGPRGQGSTFGGGPLASAAVAATFRILAEEGLVENAARTGRACSSGSVRWPAGGVVRDARGLGYLIGFDTTRPAREVVAALRERGILAGA